MSSSRRSFFKYSLGWGALAWVSSFVGSAWVLRFFKRKYRPECVDGKRLCKAKHRRQLLRRRSSMLGSGFALSRRSRVLHWPNFFKHRYAISAKNLVSIQVRSIADATQSVADTFRNLQPVPQTQDLGIAWTKIMAEGAYRRFRKAYPQRNYPEFNALLSRARPSVGELLATAICSSRSASEEIGGRQANKSAGKVQALGGNCKLLSGKLPLIAEYFALAVLKVKPDEQTSHNLQFTSESLELALKIVEGTLPVAFGEAQEKESSAVANIEIKFLKLITSKRARTRKYLRNYFLYAKLASLRYESDVATAYMLVDKTLGVPYSEMRHIEPEKWKWLDNEYTFKQWHKKIVGATYRTKLLHRVSHAQQTIMGGSASSSGKDTSSGEIGSNPIAQPPSRPTISARHWARRFWREKYAELRREFQFLPARRTATSRKQRRELRSGLRRRKKQEAALPRPSSHEPE